MKRFLQYINKFLPCRQSRDIALVLGGGGARGFAHIGVIEVLQERGYNITSVAGTSMGALVGGLFAAGKLDELKSTVLSADRRQILSLLDVSLGLDHIATADNLSQLFDRMTQGVRIEDLPLPFCCVASDLVSGREHVFREGSLSEAVRASISIPGVFSPVRIGSEVLVDGSLHNTLPLNRVERRKGDMLVAVNACAPDSGTKSCYLQQRPKPQKPQGRVSKWIRQRVPKLNFQLSENYLNMAMRVAQVAVETNAQMAIALTPPDICVDIPTDAFGLIDFERGSEIIEYGRKAMEKALAEYKKY